MQDMFRRTFGGLDRAYYLRQLFFGCLVSVPTFYMASMGQGQKAWAVMAYAIVCTLLYPYSRFVYEGVVHFIIGNNVFWGHAITALMLKGWAMMMCWIFAPITAPIGLFYLYWRNAH